MKVLIVTNYKSDNRISYFVADQVEAIKQLYKDIDIEIFGKRGSGIIGYLKNLSQLKQKIKEYQPDIIHAHYGFCGALACMQKEVPVITTFHGSDINKARNRIISNIALALSKRCIFVSRLMLSKVSPIFASKSHVIPCGISTDKFYPRSKEQCRKEMGIDIFEKIALFPASIDSKVKNYTLAKEVIDDFNRKKEVIDGTETRVRLLPLDGFSREDVAKIICAVDFLIMTSFSEGSPQVIKEAIACGCPIVSVPVGDVAIVTEKVPNAYVSKTYEVDELSDLVERALDAAIFEQGAYTLRSMGLENATIVSKIVEIYKSCIK